MTEASSISPGNPDRITELGAQYKFEIADTIDSLAQMIHKTNVEKGFWDSPHQEAIATLYASHQTPAVKQAISYLESLPLRNTGELLMLEVSELAEALEGARHGNPPDQHLPQYPSEAVELADCIIRILDHAEGRGYQLGEIILAKAIFNASRPHKHGKKF